MGCKSANKPYMRGMVVMLYETAAHGELIKEKEALLKKYDEYKKSNLKLDMSRGKPSPSQLELSEGLLTVLNEDAQTRFEGTDCRNYGVLDGLPAMRKLFAALLDIPYENIFVGGSSSLQMMFDTFARHMIFGAYKGAAPLCTVKNLKVLCPAPGYDRHFAIAQCFGAQLIAVKMTASGPDMDEVENYVKDPTVKAIWCVPKYSNPTGVTYSPETVRRFAALEPAADDFRIFWDNAYAFHDLYDRGEPLLNLYEELKKTGKENMAYIFASFSKVTYAGGSVAMMASGKENMEFSRSIIEKQTICNDKLNQLRHVLFFGNAEGVYAHMKKHAEILRPKFETVLRIFERELAPVGVGSWTKPRGGYFISLDLPEGTAARTYELAKTLGVTLTNVGDTFPYGKDPLDRNLRIAPSFPEIEELTKATEALCLCAKLAAVEKYLSR